jgi:hypothetical protein
MEYNIPEEHLLNIFGKSKSEIEELIPFMKEQEAFRLANPASERINLVRPARSRTSRGAYGEYTLGERVAPMSNDFTEELIAMANSLGMSVDELARFRDPLQYSRDNIIADRLMSRVDRDDIIRDALSQPNITNIAGVEEYVSNYIINNPIRRGRILIGQETPRQSLYDAFKEDVSDAANFFNSKGNALNKKVKKNLEKFISDYPVHEGVVLQNLPTLNLRSSGSLKKVSDKVANNSTANISSGDVFTGSLNTSHSSYLPQLKQVFKYKDGAPQFLGYKPMNNAGFLSEFHYSPEQINKYLNTEIDDLIKKGIVPNNIERPFLKNESIMLPHYGIKQYQDGGTYTVKGSKGAYKKVNGKWQVDWNRSGKYQPLSKGDVKARTAVLDKMAKPLYDKDYDEMVAYKNLSAEDKINKFEPKKEATKEDYESISNKLSRNYKPENTKLQSVEMVYPEKYLIGPGGGMIGGLLKNPYVMGASNAYFGAEGINEWADSNSDLRKSIRKVWDDPTGSNIGDAAFNFGINALNFSALPFGKYYKNYKNIGKTPIPKKYNSFKPRKPKTINLNQNPGWLQLPKVNSKSYFEYKKLKYQNGGYVDVDLTPEEIKDLIAQGYVIEELN